MFFIIWHPSACFDVPLTDVIIQLFLATTKRIMRLLINCTSRGRDDHLLYNLCIQSATAWNTLIMVTYFDDLTTVKLSLEFYKILCKITPITHKLRW